MPLSASTLPTSDWPCGQDGPSRTVTTSRRGKFASSPTLAVAAPTSLARAGASLAETPARQEQPTPPSRTDAPAPVPGRSSFYTAQANRVLGPDEAIAAGRMATHEGKTQLQIAHALGTTVPAINYAFQRIRTGALDAPVDIRTFLRARSKRAPHGRPSPKRRDADRRADLVAFADTPDGCSPAEFVATRRRERTPPLTVAMLLRDLDSVALGTVAGLPEAVTRRLMAKHAALRTGQRRASAPAAPEQRPKTPAEAGTARYTPTPSPAPRPRDAATDPPHPDAYIFEAGGVRVSVPLGATAEQVATARESLVALVRQMQT